MAHVDDNPPVSRATNAPLVSPYSLWDSPARRSPAEAGRAQLARTQVRHRRRALAVDHDERLRPGEARLGPVVRAAVAAQDALDPRPDLAGRRWWFTPSATWGSREGRLRSHLAGDTDRSRLFPLL